MSNGVSFVESNVPLCYFCSKTVEPRGLSNHFLFSVLVREFLAGLSTNISKGVKEIDAWDYLVDGLFNA